MWVSPIPKLLMRKYLNHYGWFWEWGLPKKQVNVTFFLRFHDFFALQINILHKTKWRTGRVFPAKYHNCNRNYWYHPVIKHSNVFNLCKHRWFPHWPIGPCPFVGDFPLLCLMTRKGNIFVSASDRQHKFRTKLFGSPFMEARDRFSDQSIPK